MTSRDYLAYADAGGTAVGGSVSPEQGLSPFEADVQRRLAESGITVVPRYGVGGYRVDFAAVHPGAPGRMVLAIEADGASYRDSRSARDRDRLRKQHLERLGWTFHRIWSTNWFRDPEAELAKVQAAFAESVSRTSAAPGPEEAGPEPEEAEPAPDVPRARDVSPPGQDVAIRAAGLPEWRGEGGWPGGR